MNNWKAKQRPRFRPQGRHGRIKRIVNSGIPMESLHDASFKAILKDMDDFMKAHQEAHGPEAQKAYQEASEAHNHGRPKDE